MVDVTDPFTPEAGPAGPQSNLGSQWSDALNDPRVRTSLLQFGISMLQPPSFGDTFGSQFGRSVGSAGEALSRGTAEDIRQSEADSKQELRSSQATAAEARAGAAAARAGAAGAGLELQREKLNQARDRITLSGILGKQRRQVDAANAYSRYLQTRSPIDTTPPLTREEFYNQSGFGDLLGGAAGGTKDNSSIAEQGRAAIAAGANPDAVRQRYREQTGEEAPF